MKDAELKISKLRSEEDMLDFSKVGELLDYALLSDNCSLEQQIREGVKSYWKRMFEKWTSPTNTPKSYFKLYSEQLKVFLNKAAEYKQMNEACASIKQFFEEFL